jgi:hypothetical protein
LGTDFNGFAGLPGPRQGGEACPGGGEQGTTAGVNYPFTAVATGQQMDRSVVGDKTFDINSDGLAHVGILPDLIADFQAMDLTAAELEPLLRSAEGYVNVWEKCNLPLLSGSLRQLLMRHQFQPDRGIREFIREFRPGISSLRVLFGR